MIHHAVKFLKDQLNTHIKLVLGPGPEETDPDKVQFVEMKDMDPLKFVGPAVYMLLINIEQENTLRPADRFTRRDPDGTQHKIQPDIMMNLYVLFVSRFGKYDEGLSHLSQVIKFFQGRPLFNHQNAPDLNGEIDQLAVEMVTLPFGQINEVWSALRTTYLPSVVYKVKAVVFRSQETPPAPLITHEKTLLRLS